MEKFVKQSKKFLAKEDYEELVDVQHTFDESSVICEASCKLLIFNVEDILALPQLKEGKFTKNLKWIDP